MSETVFILIGAAMGFAVAWLVLRGRFGGVMAELRAQAQRKDAEVLELRGSLDGTQAARVAAETRFQEAEKNLLEQRELIESMEGKLADTFKALSLDALTKNTEEFHKLADRAFKEHTELGKKELESKRALIDKALESVTKSIFEVQRKVEDVGQGSREKMGEITVHLKKHAETTASLSDTTDSLRKTLASSKKRGEWGERMAEDIIRLVGLVEGINYIKQKSLEGSSGRPDFTFYLPNRLKINMDVKFPMENYQHYLDAESDHDRKRYRDELLRSTKAMIKDITKNREYINPEDNTVDYVIVFIPNEQVYGFINESDTTLMDESLRQKVILCSPFTLYAVLAVIRHAVENFNLERTTSEILTLLAEFHKQWDKYKERFTVMGERLDAARKEYDSLVTTRSHALERPLKKIEAVRKQKAIALGGDISDSDTGPEDSDTGPEEKSLLE